MNQLLRKMGLFVLIASGLLTSCAPADDTVIPTLAQLPTVAPTIPLQVAPTTGASSDTSPTLDVTATPFPIILPPTIEVTPLPTVAGNAELEKFPDTLTVGEQVTLQGKFKATDVNNGVAELSNSQQQTIILLVDPFTAQVAQDQVVQVTGQIVQQPGDPTKLLQVTDIRVVDSGASPTDASVDSLPTPTQEGA